MMRRARRAKKSSRILAPADASLLDLVDNVLNKGVMIDGEVVLGVAGVDLIYLRLSAILCATDRIFSKRRK
jgi:Gas vesicle protein